MTTFTLNHHVLLQQETHKPHSPHSVLGEAKHDGSIMRWYQVTIKYCSRLILNHLPWILKNRNLSLISDTKLDICFLLSCSSFLSSSTSLKVGLWQEKTSRICSLPVCIVLLSKTRRPLSPEHHVHQQSSGTSQTETLNLMEAMNGFMENSCVESVPAPFLFSPSTSWMKFPMLHCSRLWHI